MRSADRVGLGIGGAFTALVVAIFVVLAGSPVRVERLATWQNRPPILFCGTAPEWALRNAREVVATLGGRGLLYGPVTAAECPETCLYGSRPLPCRAGAIVVDLRDRWFGDDQAGETLFTAVDGRIVRATVLLPAAIVDDSPSTSRAPGLPSDAERLALAHELVHALGYGHSYTTVSRGVVAHKTGELMNPSLRASGWGFGGLP